MNRCQPIRTRHKKCADLIGQRAGALTVPAASGTPCHESRLRPARFPSPRPSPARGASEARGAQPSNKAPLRDSLTLSHRPVRVTAFHRLPKLSPLAAVQPSGTPVGKAVDLMLHPFEFLLRLPRTFRRPPGFSGQLAGDVIPYRSNIFVVDRQCRLGHHRNPRVLRLQQAIIKRDRRAEKPTSSAIVDGTERAAECADRSALQAFKRPGCRWIARGRRQARPAESARAR